jgi:hypothetical protein
MLVWSALHGIKNYKAAPTKGGIYLIGIYPSPALASENSSAWQDDYFGKGLPPEFEIKYVGIASRSIRSRIYKHQRGRGNKGVRHYMQSSDITKLFFTYCETPDIPMEHLFLVSTNGGFEWNTKRSEWESLKKHILAVTVDAPDLPNWDSTDG